MSKSIKPQKYDRNNFHRLSRIKNFGNIQVLEIGYNNAPPGLKQIIKRNIYILHYISSGKGTFLDVKFKENSGYVVFPGELEFVKADAQEGYEVYWIALQGNAIKNIFKSCGLPQHNGVFQFKKCNECIEIIRKALFETHPQNIYEESCILQSVFYQLMSLHMQEISNPSTASLTALNIKDYIEANYHKPIKISEIAQHNNYTRNYIYTLFKKEYNMSPQEYLLTFRIEKAKLLLEDTTKDLSVSEVAYAVGFNDPLYFSKIFHKKTGISPTEFKQKDTE